MTVARAKLTKRRVASTGSRAKGTKAAAGARSSARVEPRSKSAAPKRERARSSNVVSLLFERGPHRGVSRSEILRRVHAMIDALQLENIEASIVLTDDERIHQLNKTYRGKDQPTDVLAFAMREGDFAELAGGALGDVIVSVPTARKQAQQRGESVLEEVTMLLAHGLLHLLGWDHQTAAADRRMRAETARLCRAAQAVGVTGAPRAPSRARPGVESKRSKQGADRALSRNRSSEDAPSRGRKVQVPHRVKPRRSPKG